MTGEMHNSTIPSNNDSNSLSKVSVISCKVSEQERRLFLSLAHVLAERGVIPAPNMSVFLRYCVIAMSRQFLGLVQKKELMVYPENKVTSQAVFPV